MKVRTGLTSGLQALLNMFGLKIGQNAHPDHGQAVDKSALRGEGKDGKLPEKGSLLGEDGQLLSGLGYNPTDKQAAAKNVAERANVERFMQEVNPEHLKSAFTDDKKGAEVKAEKMDKTDAEERFDRDRTERQTIGEERRLEERVDDTRAQVMQEAKNEKEQREVRETKEHEKERDQDERGDDEREKHGTPWVMEEMDREEEKKRRRGIRLDDALGAETRCHGLLEDGSRCLRKPMPGTPYCRQHTTG
jgi:hypothetical protein